MGSLRREFPFSSAVIVADLERCDLSETPLEQRYDLESTGPQTLQTLRESIWRLGVDVFHYETPSDLARNADRHRDAVVLTIYGGEHSRSRMALVPAVCESFGLRFIGPDAYGRICAQDKEISKRLAAECGLLTPSWRVVRDRDDLSRIEALTFPVVVKPLLEGTSIGIGKSNLQHHPEGARDVAAALLDAHGRPVIVEQFVPGREVSYNSIQTAAGASTAFCEVAITGRPDYFATRLLDLDEKFLRKDQRFIVNIDDEMPSSDEHAARRLLQIFGKYGYCRVDGRLHEGRFHFVELTPDAWIDPTGQFAAAYIAKGWAYDEIIAAILRSAFVDPELP